MSKKTNIVFIFSDQQRWDTLGCYGQKLDISPNLDQLAKKGVKFNNAFSCQPVCGPARSCIQTGKYATEIGCYRNGIALPQDEKTIAHWATEAGYQLGYVGKWHLASTQGESHEDIGRKIDYKTEAIPLEYRGGWKDYWAASDLLEFTSDGFQGHVFDQNMEKVEFEGYRVDKITDLALDFLEKTDEDQPFFLFTSFIEPHHQNNLNTYQGPKGSKEKYKDFEVPADLDGKAGDWKENYPDYLGCCASIDKNVGRIIDKLKKLGVEDNTVIIYTSDHGSHFKTRNGEYKRSCHESSIHIPLIISGPGFNSGKDIEELVSLLDIPATITDLTGNEVPTYMRGNSLKNLVNKQIEDWRDEVFIQISESQVGRAIRTKKWKYSVKDPVKDGFLASKSNIYQDDFLYNLEEDPAEKNNLINDQKYQDVKIELRSILKKRIKKAENEDVIIK